MGKTSNAIERSKSYEQIYVITNADDKTARWIASASLGHVVTVISPDDLYEFSLFQDTTALKVFESDLCSTTFYKDHETFLQKHLKSESGIHYLILVPTERTIPEWLFSCSIN